MNASLPRSRKIHGTAGTERSRNLFTALELSLFFSRVSPGRGCRGEKREGEDSSLFEARYGERIRETGFCVIASVARDIDAERDRPRLDGIKSLFFLRADRDFLFEDARSGSLFPWGSFLN